MSKVFVTRRIFPEALELLEKEGMEVSVNESRFPLPPEELKDEVKDADGLVCFLNDRIDEDVLESGKRLKGVSNVAAGVDNIDLDAAGERGISVTNVPGAVTGPTADLAFGLMLSLSRKISAGERYVRNGQSQEWELLGPMLGTEVSGKKLGIIGLGRIGSAVARRAKFGFDMEVFYYSRSRKEEAEEEMGVQYEELEDLLGKCDFVSLHTPLTSETEGMMAKEQFEAMKNDAFLINTSRGGVIREEDLIEALKEGELAGAGLDVFRDEPKVNPKLLEFGSRVVITPHIGSATREARSQMAMTAVRDMVKSMKGESPKNPVVQSD